MESTKGQTTHPVPQSASRPAPKPRAVTAFFTTLWTAVFLATLFTAWTPNSLFTSNLQQQLRLILTPQPGANPGVTTPQPQLRIGIVIDETGAGLDSCVLDQREAQVMSPAEP